MDFGSILGQQFQLLALDSFGFIVEADEQLILFDRPYRAQAYLNLLQRRFPSLRLDWYRTPRRRFEVVLLYGDESGFGEVLGIDGGQTL